MKKEKETPGEYGYAETYIRKGSPLHRFSQLIGRSWLGRSYNRLKFRIVARLEHWDRNASQKQRWLYLWCFLIFGSLFFAGGVLIELFANRAGSEMEIKHIKPVVEVEGKKPPVQENERSTEELGPPADSSLLGKHEIQRINRMADFAMQDTTSLEKLEKLMNHP